VSDSALYVLMIVYDHPCRPHIMSGPPATRVPRPSSGTGVVHDLDLCHEPEDSYTTESGTDCGHASEEQEHPSQAAEWSQDTLALALTVESQARSSSHMSERNERAQTCQTCTPGAYLCDLQLRQMEQYAGTS
jgi:hypothetical protein